MLARRYRRRLTESNEGAAPVRSATILFVIVTFLVAVTFFIYNLIVFFQPNKIVEGTFALVAAMSGIALAVSRFVPAKIPEAFGRAVVFVHDNHRAMIAFALIIWTATFVWSAVMWKDVFGRYVYVHALQKSLQQGESDRASLPNSELLAEAFRTFPNRREVPFLLARSSRLFFQANRRDLFRSFQSGFLDHLDIEAILPTLCSEKASTARADGLVFLTMTAAEAYPFEATLGGQAATNDAIKKLERFIAPLSKCASFEANVQRIRLQDSINDLVGQQRYDTTAEMTKLDEALKKDADEKKVLKFWQSHAAQEYLDFKAYRILSNPKDRASGRLEEALSHYETLLLLRQSATKSGEVIWNATPFKLNLFPAFMIASNLKSLVYPHHIDMFANTTDIAMVIKGVTDRKSFEEFRSPRGWYAGTPLDISINGSAVSEKINSWLKEDW